MPTANRTARATGRELFAVGALCTRYGGPLADGLFVGDTIRCPWHHPVSALAPAKRSARRRWSPSRGGLSKNFLAGTEPSRSVPHWLRAFFETHKITLRLNTRAAAIDTAARLVELSGGKRVAYAALLVNLPPWCGQYRSAS